MSYPARASLPDRSSLYSCIAGAGKNPGGRAPWHASRISFRHFLRFVHRPAEPGGWGRQSNSLYTRILSIMRYGYG